MNKQEQLDIVRRMIADGVVTQEQAAKYFPEITESEDGRIRKKVIDVLKLNVRGAESQMQASRGVDRTFEVYACNKVIAWLEKQCEQKPTEEYNITGIGSKHAQGKLGEMIKNLKSAWSEEDEKTIDEAVEKLERYAEYVQGGYSKQYVLDLASRVESLKERVQPKQKWSKEDKVMLGEIIDFFENGTVKLQHDLSLYASWLKSLRPQNTWKPSDEQMKALNTCIMQGEISYVGQGTELQSLYNDLKKLTE